MPIHLRHQSPMDLRTAAKADAIKDSDSYSFRSHSSDSSGEFIYHDAPTYKPGTLRLAMANNILQHRYQSDEEQVSPNTDDSNHLQEEEFDSEDSSDFDDVEVISAFEIAKKVEVVYVGRPAITSIAKMAPMQRRHSKRTSPPARPAVVIHTASAQVVPSVIPRRSPLRERDTKRAVSMYEPPIEVGERDIPVIMTPPPINFSNPLRGFTARPSPLGSNSPPTLVEPSSPTSSDMDSDIESFDEEDLLPRASEEIRFRTPSMEQEIDRAFNNEEDDFLGKPPTPTSYHDYDPFALAPPTLAKTATEPEETKKWKGLGLGRKVRLGRTRGRKTTAS